jgi:two-component system, OmpR family, phosphate regulon response regulator PhoB
LRQVLIAENDPEQRDLMVFQLEAHGFSVRLCADAEQVLSIAGDDVAAVVLKEHPAAGMTGLEICRRLRRRPETANVPILMVSDITSEDESVDAFGVGADGWLSEPVHPHELIIRLNGLLNRVRRHPIPCCVE